MPFHIAPSKPGYQKTATEKILQVGESNWTNCHSSQKDILYTQLLHSSITMISFTCYSSQSYISGSYKFCSFDTCTKVYCQYQGPSFTLKSTKSKGKPSQIWISLIKLPSNITIYSAFFFSLLPPVALDCMLLSVSFPSRIRVSYVQFHSVPFSSSSSSSST